MSSQNLRPWLPTLLALLLSLAGASSAIELRAADGEGLASSARPEINDAADRRLQQARAAMESGDFPLVRAELRRLLDAAAIDGVVPVGAADQAAAQFESVTRAALRLLNSLPDSERRQFIQQSEPEAARRLQSFLVSGGSSAELQSIADRYPATPSARQAQRLLISRLLDRGQLWQARAVLQKFKREWPATDSQAATLTRRLQQIDTLADLESKVSNNAVRTPSAGNAGTAPRVWQAAAAFEDSSVGWFQQALGEHRRQAIPVLPRLTPVVAGRVVIGRTLTQLVAVEAATGRPLWQAQSPATGGQRPSRAPLTGALESLAAVSMARQVQLDTTYSHMTVDDDRVLCLEYVSSFGRSLSTAGPTVPNDENDDAQPRNELVARRVSDGRIEWRRPAFLSTDAGFATDAEFADAAAYFSGVPTVHGNSLVGLLQHDAALFVYALDRQDGTPRWMLKIGERTGLIAADADWTSIACPVLSADGLLICSTGSGLLTAVDPVFRRVVWARRYNRVDDPPPGSPLPGSANRLTRRWWSGWREITLFRSPSRDAQAGPSTLLYAGPDVRGVHILDTATGELRATVPASQPLYLEVPETSSDGAQSALLVARHSLTAFDLPDGTVRWNVGIPEPSGRGFRFSAPQSADASFDGDFYIFPARDGTTRRGRLRDGLVTTGREIDSGTPRTWTLCATGVLEQTFEDLQWLPLPEMNAQGELRWTTGFETEAGHDDPLLTTIQHANSEDGLRKIVARAGLSSEPASDNSDVRQRDESEFDRPGAAHAVAAIRKARQLQANSLAFELLLNLSKKNPNGAVSLRDSGPERTVRYDRWIQGQLTDLLSAEGASSTSGIQQRFDAAVESARNSLDPFALARLVERLRAVPGVEQLETEPEGRVGRSFLQNEIALLRLSTASDPVVASRARQQLVELYLTNRYERDAAAIVALSEQRRRSQNEERVSSTDRRAERVSPADNGDQLLPTDRANELLASARRSEWKAATPKLSERPDRFEEVRYFPVPVTSERGAVFERLNVAVRLVGKSGSSLRFYGDGQAGYWKLELPKSESALHTWFTLPRGWGIGRLLILRIGTELYGVTPYSENGEPRAQLRWTLDMADGNRLNTHQLAHPTPGFGAEDLTPLDAFDQPLAQVGPVQAGYLCYRDRGQLICLDPETGQQLWTRSELQPQTRCVGNEQSIWLLDDSTGTVTELRSTDGAALDEFNLADLLPSSDRSDKAADHQPPQVLKVRGHHWLLGRGRQDSTAPTVEQLALLDARSRRIIWSLPTDAASVVFNVGRHWFGLIDKNGQLSIRDAESGTAIARHHIDVPSGLRSTHCITDNHAHLLAFSTDPESGFQAVGEPRFGFRAPLINGKLAAISAHDGSLLWQQSVHDERLLLDQPRSLPILTLTSRTEQACKAMHALRIVDRRNGETLTRRKSAEQFAPFTFDPNAALQRVVLRFPRSTLRIDYDAP